MDRYFKVVKENEGMLDPIDDFIGGVFKLVKTEYDEYYKQDVFWLDTEGVPGGMLFLSGEVEEVKAYTEIKATESGLVERVVSPELDRQDYDIIAFWLGHALGLESDEEELERLEELLVKVSLLAGEE